MTIAELIQYIFQGQQNDLAPQFESWVKDSRRFRVFAEGYRDKIRKKLRTSPDEATLASLSLELETGYLLLRDPRFTIEYEKLVGKGRGPDFSVTFRVNTLFHMEVTRLRIGDSGERAENAISPKLVEMVCDKVGQMPSGSINLLILASTVPVGEGELAEAMADLRVRAERKQEDFFTRRSFESAAAFLRQFQQLSAILYRSEDATQPGNPSFIWLNSLAKRPLPKELHNALRKALNVKNIPPL